MADTNSSPTVQQTSDSSANTINQSFINRFNDSIKLVNDQFVIVQSQLPKDTTQDELVKLNQIIAQSNSDLQQQLSLANKNNIAESDNSIVIADNLQTAESEMQGTTIQTRAIFHEGSNYVHTYWWGKRVGVSRTTIRKVGSATAGGVGALAGVLYFIPAPQVKAAGAAIQAAAGILGFGLAHFPGGVVFNTTPNYLGSQIWAVQFQ
ncbi:MAG: hypothetical protein FWH31_04925 [Streptococcaceae bacterium]|nr:hypothetical protein [Streptococcaceae bacterium]